MRIRIFWAATSSLCFLLASQDLRAASDLAGQIQALAQQADIEVSGLDKVAGKEAVDLSDDRETALQELRSLLKDFSYILVHASDGSVSTLKITGPKKEVTAPRRDAVETKRVGSHHMVEAILEGSNERPVAVAMLLDTGATNLTLPASMIEVLGFRRDDLRRVMTATANGPVEGLKGTLELVKLGRVEASGVAVSFIEDELLGEQKLLGMSFLGRFRITIDDRHNRVILVAKQ